MATPSVESTLEPNPQLVHREVAIEPDLPIVETHHHLWDNKAHWMATYYPVDQLLEDVRGGGHNVVKTVFLECSSHYYTSGPEQLKSVGETEWVASQNVPTGVMAGIVGNTDIRLIDLPDTLEAHRAAGDGRFRGIRYSAAWDSSPDVPNTSRELPQYALLDSEVRRGTRELGDAGLVLDTWVYFHQLDDVAALAQSAPQTTIVLDHLGGPAGTGPYAGHRDEVREQWKKGMLAVAKQPNVVLKVGGLGFRPYIDPAVFDSLQSSNDIAAYWQDDVTFAIDTFGPDRSMFETNYPVDSAVADFVTLWNSIKLMTRGYSDDERSALFAKTAERAYSI